MYLLQVLQTHRIKRIVHILLHFLLLLVSYEVFLLPLLPHIQVDVYDVFCSSSSLMDTLWQGVLSCDSCIIDIGSSLSSDYFLFSFETSWEVDTPCDFPS